MGTTNKAILLIILSSICAGAGQLMWKLASEKIELNNLFSIFNIYMFTGVLIYLFATILMILAFREGELSVLHPFLATSYIWVLLISPFLLSGESWSTGKVIGALLISSGVSLIGIGGKKI